MTDSTAAPHDTPVTPPVSKPEAVKAFIGDLARPFALISVAASCSAGLLIEYVGADKLGLALTALGAMYAAKAAENATTAKHHASAEVAKAQGPTG